MLNYRLSFRVIVSTFLLLLAARATAQPAQIEVFDGAVLITNDQTIPPVNFGTAQQYSTGPSITFTITNAGGKTLSVGTVTPPSGYLVTVQPANAIPGGTSAAFTVQLDTTINGTNQGLLSISNGAPAGPDPYVFKLYGIVLPAPPQIQVFDGTNAITNNQATPVNFGSVLQNSAGISVTFTVSNSGSLPLNLQSITVPANYSLAPAYSSNISAGSNGTFTVQLDTVAEGAIGGNIVISDNDTNNDPYILPISGTVLGKVASVSGLSFGVVPIGSTKTQTLTISNAGNTNLTVSNILYPNAAFTGNWSNGIITNGQSQQVTVTFTPAAGASYIGSITIISDATSGTTNSLVTAFGANDGLILTIITNGQGSVTPNDAKSIPLGTKVALRATPEKGYVFAGWSGSTNSTNNPLVFNMEESTVVEVNFILDPFVAFVGTYNGLFWPSNGVITETTAGMLKNLALTSKGTYSATILYDGASKGFTGNFNVEGTATKTVSMGDREGTLDLVMNLTSNGTALQITGTVSGNGRTGFLTADRATNVLPSAEYTLLIPPDINNAPPTGSPGGDGYALITNSAGNPKNPATANAKITGALADGTAFNQTAPVSEDGFVPIYANLYHNSGLLIGWLNLNLSNTEAISATGLTWIHPATTSGLYQPGFTNIILSNQLLLALWTNTLSSDLDLTTLLASTTMTNTNALTSIDLIVSASGKIGPPPVSGSYNPKTGYFNVTWGAGATKTTGCGAILSDGTNGISGGYYLTKTNAQAVKLVP